MRGRGRFLFLALLWEAAIVSAIALACLFEGFRFALFYHLGYGLILSVLLPLAYGLPPAAPKSAGLRPWFVALPFLLLSLGGRLLPPLLQGRFLPQGLLPLCVLPIAMTTLFEEIFFRGFLQSRFEKLFGGLWAVIFSAAFFSLYHLGYPGFRSAGDLLLLFAVGLGFALVYRLSDGNLWAAYAVNFPNALITYLEKPGQFPRLEAVSSFYAGGVLLFLACLFIVRRFKRV